jgi:hypothetical protein
MSAIEVPYTTLKWMCQYGLPLTSEYILLAVVVVAAFEAQDVGINDAEVVVDTDADAGDDSDADDVELGVAVEDTVI